MSERSGKFTRERCEAREASCMRHVDGGLLRFVPIMSPMRTLNDESRANANILAAAINSGNAAEDMGYDGQAAVEALPGLLEVVNEAARLIGLGTKDGDSGARVILSTKGRAVLEFCRAKELS